MSAIGFGELQPIRAREYAQLMAQDNNLEHEVSPRRHR